MRRKHLILASCIISALLLTFTFHVSADETPKVDAGASSNSAPLLDSYFWDNYTLLPYIESSGQQYINTGINPSVNIETQIKFSINPDDINDYNGLFGSRDSNGENALSLIIIKNNNQSYFQFSNLSYQYNIDYSNYAIYDIKLSNSIYVNGNLIYTFGNGSISNNNPIYIFSRDDGGSQNFNSKFKLYSFSLYDSSLSDPEDLESDPVGYVRYYYPAKSNSSGIIGLYDAVSKTFVSTATSTPFENPTDDKVIHFQIASFITAGLGWIGDILEYAITEPIILFFMAIGLCGVAFRWARRVYHF